MAPKAAPVGKAGLPPSGYYYGADGKLYSGVGNAAGAGTPSNLPSAQALTSSQLAAANANPVKIPSSWWNSIPGFKSLQTDWNVAAHGGAAQLPWSINNGTGSPPATPTAAPTVKPGALIPAGANAGAVAGANGGGLSGVPQMPDLSKIQMPDYASQQIPLPGGQYNTGAENQLLNNMAGQNTDIYSYLPQANQYALQSLAPQLQSLQQLEGVAGNNIVQFNQGTNNALANLRDQVGGYYDNAINTGKSVDKAIGTSLANANPNATNQALLQTAGAPADEKSVVGNSARNGFNLGGAVISGLGGLTENNMAAAKANALSSAAQIPGLLATSGQQALAGLGASTQAAATKILAQAPGIASKLASSEVGSAQKRQSNDLSLVRTLSTQDNELRNARLGVMKANQSSNLTARRDATSAYNSAIRNTISAYRAQVTGWKAANPTATASSASKLASNLVTWRYGKTTTTNRSSTGPSGTTVSGSTTTSAQPKTWDEAMRAAAIELGPNASPQSVSSYVNMIYSEYGVAGRPLDPNMQQSLQKANLPTGIETGHGSVTDAKGNVTGSYPVYYLTPAQGHALIAAGQNPDMTPTQVNGQTWFVLSKGDQVPVKSG